MEVGQGECATPHAFTKSKFHWPCRHLYAAALLDEEGKMIGSVLVVDFPSKNELDQWLKIEPYIIGNVWQKYEVKPCRVGPSFVGSHR